MTRAARFLAFWKSADRAKSKFPTIGLSSRQAIARKIWQTRAVWARRQIAACFTSSSSRSLKQPLQHFIKIGVIPEVLAFLKVFPQHLSGEESARTQKHELYPRPASWKKVSDVYEVLRKADKNLRQIAVAGIIGDSVAAEFMLLAEEIKNMKSVDELLEIQRKTPDKIGKNLPSTLNGLYALSFAIATRATEETAEELLELINRLDEQTSENFALLPMRELQTMAGSLLLDKIWKEGWKVENSKAFWRYNEKREAASLNQKRFRAESRRKYRAFGCRSLNFETICRRD